MAKSTYQIKCQTCNETQFVLADSKDVSKWMDGVHIQEAMPYLSPEQRELFISKICPTCWTKFFGSDEEEAPYEDNCNECEATIYSNQPFDADQIKLCAECQDKNYQAHFGLIISEPQVLKSNAGYYVGRLQDGMPYDRLSGYFATREEAQDALDTTLELIKKYGANYEDLPF